MNYDNKEWQVELLKEHVLKSIEWCGNDERKGILHSRRHIAAAPTYKCIPNFRETKIAMLRAESLDELFELMKR